MHSMLRRRTYAWALALSWIFVALPASAADGLTGTWLLAVTTQMGKGDVTLVLEQQGDKLTGTYKGSLGEQPVEGKVTNDEFELAFKADMMGSAVDVQYAGKVEDDAITGKVSFGSLGEGSFEGKRKP